MRILLYLILCLFFIPAYSQVQIDHPIQLTGSGTNAKIMGIQSVTNTQDATSVGSVQSGNFIYADATGTGNNFEINITPPISAYQKGMMFSFKSNQTINGPGTLNINGLGAVPVKKYVNQDIGGCEIQTGQMVTVIHDGVNFQIISLLTPGGAPSTANAGPDQLNVPHNSTITLAANLPGNGTGLWSIVTGAGGNISNPSSPTSTFTGQDSVIYILVWSISNTCGISNDSVSVSYTNCYSSGMQTFNFTGSQQTFTVPCGVDSVTITAYGAQGATGGNTGNPGLAKAGGLGGQSTGKLAVTSGEALYVLVGGQNGYNGGGVGGNGNGGSYGIGGIGGGSSDIRIGGTDFGNRVIVAGGGGGGGGQENGYYSGAGGTGGGNTGGQGDRSEGNPAYSPGGLGGTQGAGGAGSCYTGGGGVCGTDGTLGQGGTGANWNSFSGGGGGGGYYGGGGSSNWAGGAGGGGGSGYIGGVANGSMQNGVQSGNGQIVITW